MKKTREWEHCQRSLQFASSVCLFKKKKNVLRYNVYTDTVKPLFSIYIQQQCANESGTDDYSPLQNDAIPHSTPSG